MQRNALLLGLVFLQSFSGCLAYPELFASRHARTSCIDHPSSTKQYGSHGRLGQDQTVSIEVSAAGKPITVLCPGGQYAVKVAFPQPRLALVTTSLATLKDATNKSCPNQLVTPKAQRVGAVNTVLSVSCAASGRELDFKVSSATGKDSRLGFTRVMLPVDAATAPHCAEVSRACAPALPAQLKAGEASDAAGSSGSSVFVPLTPAAVDTSKSDAKEGNAANEPVYTFYPVLGDNKWLWQFLHSLLMLLAFCFLLPLGSLLARHKWIFGRDVLSGRVLTSWGPVHVVTQVVGLAAAAAGVVIAILAFGWKEVPGQRLYSPHKFMGLGVMGMALLQGVLGILRPEPDARGRGMWDCLHHSWGRLTIVAGMANAILGALLVHDLSDVPYLHWLLPACVLVGLVGVASITLEAFKMQMQRTYRYNHKSGAMLPVMEGYKHSKRRPGGSAAKFAGGMPSDHTSDTSDDVLHMRDTDEGLDQDTHYPTVTHRTGPIHASIKPPHFHQ